MSILVYSTLTSDVQYRAYAPNKNGEKVPRPIGTVLIRGGAGVADKRGDTIPGRVNEISKEALNICRQDKVFRQHIERGFIFVDENGTTDGKIESVASEMAARDASSPRTEGDFADQGIKPSVAHEEAPKPKAKGK